MNALITKSIAAVAAATTTVMLFAAVISLADNDKAALHTAKTKPTQVATTNGAVSAQR